MKKVKLYYKSGNVLDCELDLTVEEIDDRIKNNEIDINLDTFSMIRWSEVEAIIWLRKK